MRSCGRAKARVDHGPVHSVAALLHRRFGLSDQNGLGHGRSRHVDFHFHAPPTLNALLTNRPPIVEDDLSTRLRKVEDGRTLGVGIPLGQSLFRACSNSRNRFRPRRSRPATATSVLAISGAISAADLPCR